MDEHVEMMGDVAVFHFPWDHLNANNAKEFKEDIQSVLRDRDKVVFDLAKLSFVDSMGLAAVLSCLRQQNREGGDLKLCGLSASVRSLFEMVRLHRVFDLLNDTDEAVRAYG
jgi:anti-sigma B factor antagonist